MDNFVAYFLATGHDHTYCHTYHPAILVNDIDEVSQA
jgi:hypothetical protein